LKADTDDDAEIIRCCIYSRCSDDERGTSHFTFTQYFRDL